MHKRVLVPLDGSTVAEQALPHAIAEAERFRSELILLRAIRPLPSDMGLSFLELGWVQEQACEWARDYLESIATHIRTRGVPVKVVVVQEPPHEAITHFSESHGVDLIVICSRGESGAKRWLMGSVADRVVRGSAVPVLLVRALERKDRSRALWEASSSRDPSLAHQVSGLKKAQDHALPGPFKTSHSVHRSGSVGDLMLDRESVSSDQHLIQSLG